MRADFLGVPVDCLTMSDTLARARQAMVAKQPVQHIALNVAKFVHMQANPDLRADVFRSDIVGVDGMGIVMAARAFGVNVPERVAGVDLMIELLDMCGREGFRPYLLGATQEVLDQALANVRTRFPNLQLAGSHHGYFKPGAEEKVIVETIRESGADCLFVGMPTPRKENFMAEHRDTLGVPFVMGVGGGIDVLAGHVKRAPGWMQRYALEWFFRVVQEPRRMWKRYLTTNIAFAAILLKARIGIMPFTATPEGKSERQNLVRA